MRMLVIGGRGMAGHLLIRYFRQVAGADVTYTVRDPQGLPGELKLDASRLEDVERIVGDVRPDVIVNAAGVLNHDAESHPTAAYMVNGLLPHWLRHVADRIGARLIHISSDCVFSGARGGYAESDIPDGTSVYARTKALGEVRDPRHLTIRTSIIGPEIRAGGIGLLGWFLQQTGKVNGYAQVYWNGVTTLELAKAVAYACAHPEIGGLVHLTAPRSVSKHELLGLFRQAFDRDDIAIDRVEEPQIDRTLVKERTDWGYEPQDYPAMLQELAEWMRQEASA